MCVHMYVCVRGIQQSWICFIKETLNQLGEGRQDLSGKMDNRNILWKRLFVCVCARVCLRPQIVHMYLLPTHIICHINRFVHQCTGTGSLFLSVSIAANSGWKKIGMLIINPSQLWPTFTQVILPEKLVRAVRPLIKLASQRSSWEIGGLLGKAGQSDTLTNLKDQSGAEKRPGETGSALITLCVEDKWQVWATYWRLVRIMIWLFGLDAALKKVRGLCTVCHVRLQGCFLFFCRS